ncbi:hypothetical protein BKA12_001742 [Neomicrococcus lactis]|uniref:Uncharacterized protein n=1 Tax=Neomicrococcus lactis TaxID=732241 RepID=A0A7W8YC41_9MICC|nr:hypothetical protein [Neomicrococcus lactis]
MMSAAVLIAIHRHGDQGRANGAFLHHESEVFGHLDLLCAQRKKLSCQVRDDQSCRVSSGDDVALLARCVQESLCPSGVFGGNMLFEPRDDVRFAGMLQLCRSESGGEGFQCSVAFDPEGQHSF